MKGLALMLPKKSIHSKKLPGKHFPKTVYSTSEKNKQISEFTEFGEEFFFSKEDPNGMYTGFPTDKYETPVQDADDL